MLGRILPKVTLQCTAKFFHAFLHNKKLRGLSPRANYTDRAAAAGRRS